MEVARHAQVGRSTVSLVLNNHADAVGISQATRRRVRRAARELGYAPSFAGRALRNQRTQNIGFLMSDMGLSGQQLLPAWSLRLAYLEPALSRRGFNMLVFRYEPGSADRILAQIATRCVDGLILTAMRDQRVLRLCRRLSMPCVDVVGKLDRARVCTVEADLVSARVEALRHAAGLGHRRIALAYIRLPLNEELVARILARAAADPALCDCRIDCYPVPHNLPAGVEGKHVLDAWLARPAPQRATCVLAHDNIVHTFLNVLGERGMRCPDDLSVIGLSYSPFTETIRPRLTSIDNRGDVVIDRATQLLTDAVNDGRVLSSKDSLPMVPCRLIVGESCISPD